MSSACIEAVYGAVAADPLQHLQRTYDTQALLHCIGEYDEVLEYLGSEGGTRDALARAYCMTATVLAGSSTVVPPQDGDLHTVLADLQEDLEEAIVFFQSVVDAVKPLRQLQP